MGRDQLVTVAEAAQQLGLKVPTVRKLIYQRRVAVVRIGRAVRLRECDLHQFIQDHLSPAVQAEDRPTRPVMRPPPMGPRSARSMPPAEGVGHPGPIPMFPTGSQTESRPSIRRVGERDTMTETPGTHYEPD